MGGSYLVRLDRGEQALESLRAFADRYRIGFAVIRAIGTLASVTLGYYDALSKTYRDRTLEEPLEVLNLSGNIAKGEGGKRVVHAHVTVGRPDYTTLGGHMVEATVGPTLEVVIESMPIAIHRRYDPDTGLKLWDLEGFERVSL
jgi:predicted DNA-binding protein with PD1-like motif